MSKDSQNVVLVFLSIVIVIVVVIGGGYWYLNYGDSIFESNNSSNKTVVPKKTEKLGDGEYALPLDNPEVQSIITNIDNFRVVEKTLPAGLIQITKVAYARSVIENRIEKLVIYENYAYKRVMNDESNIVIGYKYYLDYDMNNLITESTEEIDDQIFDTNSETLGIYKYTYTKDNNGKYTFTNFEKVR